MIVATAVMDNAACRFSGGNVSSTMSCCIGCSPPPNSPCRPRNNSNSPKFVDSPQASDAAVNPVMEMRKYFLRPSCLLSEAETTRVMPLATK